MSEKEVEIKETESVKQEETREAEPVKPARKELVRKRNTSYTQFVL